MAESAADDQGFLDSQSHLDTETEGVEGVEGVENVEGVATTTATAEDQLGGADATTAELRDQLSMLQNTVLTLSQRMEGLQRPAPAPPPPTPPTPPPPASLQDLLEIAARKELPAGTPDAIVKARAHHLREYAQLSAYDGHEDPSVARRAQAARQAAQTNAARVGREAELHSTIADLQKQVEELREAPEKRKAAETAISGRKSYVAALKPANLTELPSIAKAMSTGRLTGDDLVAFCPDSAWESDDSWNNTVSEYLVFAEALLAKVDTAAQGQPQSAKVIDITGTAPVMTGGASGDGLPDDKFLSKTEHLNLTLPA